MWTDGVHCQRFFTMRKWQRYFAVHPVAAEAADHPPGGLEDKEQQADAILAHYESSIKEAKSRHAVENDSSRLVPNAWLAFTGWPGHLSKLTDKEQIQPYIQRTSDGVDEDMKADVSLEDACRGTRRLIRAVFKVCKADMVGKAALESANRRETGAESNERPFYVGHQMKTICKYSDSFVNTLRYTWRTAVETERPKYQMTERQLASLEMLRGGAAPGSGGNETEEITTQSIAERKEARRKAIEDACLVFWIAMFDHELRGNEFKSGIINGLAVLGIDAQSGSWKAALNYTPILSTIATVMRALVVCRSWQIRQQSIQSGVATGLSLEEAADTARSVVEGVDKLVERFTALRKFGGRISPMDRILHMRTYGIKIRMTTKADRTVSWEGGSILVNKIKFSMDDIRTVVHGLLETTRRRLKRELLFISNEGELPALDLKALSDNAAELSEGWNFLQDRHNHFVVDGERWLWRRMFKEKVIERRFVKSDLEDARGREYIQWNEKNVEYYFRTVRRHNEELLALADFGAGAQARATSLISSQTKNGREGRGHRGVFIENGTVVLVTGYDKGSSMSQKVKIIHRYVPREVGELFIYTIWLLNPWVQQLQAMVRGQTEFSSFIWSPNQRRIGKQMRMKMRVGKAEEVRTKKAERWMSGVTPIVRHQQSPRTWMDSGTLTE